MATFQLTPGDHTITWSKTGYQDLTVKIRVSSSGTVTCLEVIGSTCSATTAPKVAITGGSTVTGYLVQQTQSSGICQWINSKGGPDDISTQEVFELIDARLGTKQIGFTPTTREVFGAIDYRLKNKTSGNNGTGCNYT